MRFTKALANENFDVLRCVSENSVWELGIRSVLFGIRICANPVGDDCYWLGYCAGDDFGFALVLLATVAKILEQYPENTDPQQIKLDFPKYDIKPINRDPYCWRRLQEMAGMVATDYPPFPSSAAELFGFSLDRGDRT